MANEQAETPTRKLFITGGDLGVGRALLGEAVARGHKVVATTENGAKGANIIRDLGGLPVYPDTTRAGELRSVMQMAQADVVVHLAAQALNGPPQHAIDYEKFTQRLVDSTNALTDAAGKVGVQRVILASSALVYGDTGDHDPVTEDAAIHVDNALQDAYADAEAIVLDGGIPGYVLRGGFLYGGHSPAMDGLVNDIRKGNNLPHGTGVVSWLHQDDLVDAILRIAERDADDDMATIYNLSDDDFMSHDTFATELAAEMGLPEPNYRGGLMAPFLENKKQSAILKLTTRINSQKAHDDLGWSPEFTRKSTGIGKMLMQWRAESAPATPPADDATNETEIVPS